MSTLNQLTPSDIETAVNDLLNKNGQTTSMEVKEELRKRGFWATQAIVGVAMREIAEDNQLPWDFNGTFRTYHKQGTNMSPTSASAQGNLVPATPAKPKRIPLDPGDRDPIDPPSVGDWNVFDVKGNGAPLAFKGKLSEGQAKYAYQLKTPGTPFVDVRAERA